MLKYRLLIVVFAFLAVITNALGQEGYQIELTATNSTEESAIIGYHYGKQRLLLDTLLFDSNQTVTLAGTGSLPAGVYFLYAPSVYFEFIVNEQQFSIVVDQETGYSGATIINSRENELYKQFQVTMSRIQRDQAALVNQLDSISGQDSLEVRLKIADLSNESRDFRKQLIEDNQGTFVASFVKLMEGIVVPDFDSITDPNERQREQFMYFKSHYFDLIDDPVLVMRTPVVHNFVMKYFDELVLPQADSVNKEIDLWLNQFANDREGFRYWLVVLTNQYQDSKIMGMDGVTVHLADNYYLTEKVDWMTEKAKTDLRNELAFIRPNLLGKTAPDMVLVDTLLKPVNFKELKSEYLVLFFYDPDCGVCKKKTPVLIGQYEEIKALGGEVLAICTISEIDKWKDYIIRNEMKWVNLADPFGRSRFRLEYNVRSTPQLYILGRDFEILAKKLDVEQVIEYIQNHKAISEL